MDILDRLRVTIKITKGEQSIRHNLDLYNDTQVDKLIRKMAERLEIGSILAGKLISGLTDQLEAPVKGFQTFWWLSASRQLRCFT